MKSGEVSPVYFDLRVIVAHPEVMDELTDLMLTFIQEKEIQCDQLCGVPYTGKTRVILPNAHLYTLLHSQLCHSPRFSP